MKAATAQNAIKVDSFTPTAVSVPFDEPPVNIPIIDVISSEELPGPSTAEVSSELDTWIKETPTTLVKRVPLNDPLDVGFFRPLKIAWRQTLEDWKKINLRTTPVPKESFPHLLKKAIINMDQKPPNNDKDACTEMSAIKRNLVSSFKATGIVPFDRNRVLNKLPPESPSPEMETVVRDSLTEFLKEQRFGEESHPPRKRTRLLIEPGKSISTVDETSNQEVNVVELEHTLDGNDCAVRTEMTSMQQSMQSPIPIINEPSSSYQTSQDDNNSNFLFIYLFASGI
uniref:Uncharacterized protein n=1 Tax=Heliothis virescens TaxID=7102 RepID=A0A2A4JD56_HELVI